METDQSCLAVSTMKFDLMEFASFVYMSETVMNTFGTFWTSQVTRMASVSVESAFEVS